MEWSSDFITPALHCSIPLRCGAPGFFAQILNDEPEALIQDEFFEHFLPAKRVIDEGRSHEIREHLGIAELGKIFVHFLGELATVLFQPGIELKHFCTEGVGLHR